MPNISLPSLKTNAQPVLFFRIYAPVSHPTHIPTAFSGPKKAFKYHGHQSDSILLGSTQDKYGILTLSITIVINTWHLNRQSCLLMNSLQYISTDSDNKILRLAKKALPTIQGQLRIKALTCSRPQMRSVMGRGFNWSLCFSSPRLPGLYTASDAQQEFSVNPSEFLRNLHVDFLQRYTAWTEWTSLLS